MAARRSSSISQHRGVKHLSKRNLEQLYDDLLGAYSRINRFNIELGAVLPDKEYRLLSETQRNLAALIDRIKM